MTSKRSGSLGMLACVIAGVVALAWSSPMPGMALLARTMLVMGGTEHPLVNYGAPGQSVGWPYPSYPLGEPDMADAGGAPAGYVLAVHDNYVVPWGADGEQYSAVAVYTPQEFAPVHGGRTFDESVAKGYENAGRCLHARTDCIAHIYPGGVYAPGQVVVGYSQSAVIASLLKQDLLENPGTAPDASFVLIANPMRPNGGLLQRAPRGMTIPLLGITAYGPTPTHSCDANGHCAFPTVDIAQQYDALGGDFPIYPLHLLAVANSLAAFALLHGTVPDQHLSSAVAQGVYGDTSYYLLSTDLVPLLTPFDGVVPRPILLAVDAPLRVLIEVGYRRDISPGQPTPAQLIPVVNPVSLAINLARSVPVGIDNAAEDRTGERPLGTEDPGPYGVGGDDADLTGLPPGLVPLGSTQPTPTPTPTQPESVPIDDATLAQDSDIQPAGKPIVRKSGPLTPLTRAPAGTEEDSPNRLRLRKQLAKQAPDTLTGPGPQKPDRSAEAATAPTATEADEGSET